jgi:hypothetical protein
MEPNNIPPVNTPHNQPDQFDFILKDKPKPKKNLIPNIMNLPRSIRLAVSIVLAFIVIVVLFVLVLGIRVAGSDKLINVVAQAQEIVRVDTVASQQAKNANSATQNLIATSSTILTSQQTELTQYLKNNKIKISKAKLNTDLDKSVDAQLKSAAQNNSLDKVYLTYLKDQLNSYQTALQAAHKSAGKSGKAILSKDFNSIQTLLKAPQLVGISN